MSAIRTIIATALILVLLLPGSGQAAQDQARVAADHEQLAWFEGLLMLDGRGFSGVLFDNHDDDSLRKEVHYLDGRRHGESLRYYPDGNMSSRTVFVHGNRSGDSVGWWPDGQLQYWRHYEHGLLEGESLEWHQNGQLRYRQNFSQGKEQGLQQGWLDDGESAFAYEYREGRRYGVLGSKPCFTATTDAQELFNENL